MTKRDIKILKFINRFGKVNTDQIAAYLEVSKVRTYQIMQRLKKSGMVELVRVFHNEPGIYLCTSEGAKFTNQEKLRELHIASLKHDLKILDVFLNIRDEMQIESFMTEREIRKSVDLEHFPDLLIKYSGEQISIEVELSRKSKTRMEAIRNFYLKTVFIKKVIYFVPKSLKTYIESIYHEYDFIEVRDLV
ncbi:MAG: helix-turn-helix domain-containing protein [Reichenbachiella sp.]|uniref:helix-turn-helix domain-containing protein n=1 Tax=Reichenbachiella sp. TaxID=2184521 RepID=UPI002966B03E|nr:helix-turn-helix domain-containing protein [Reichenbachiella sp.]MDW3209289.1 helix-turn-helix domain-containing protein [Reichenbachiella sp.]